MTVYVPRTKTDREKLRGAARTQRDAIVTLVCGHTAVGIPPVSNPDRWWCCSSWQRAKTREH